MATQVILHRAAVRAILQGVEGTVDDDLNRRGAAVARAAGPDYISQGWVGKVRYRVTVKSTKRNPRSQLLAALDAAKS